jgi:hypothetical protein
MSWLKYVWASLIGSVVAVVVATSAATLILWLTFSRYVAWSCAGQPPPGDCGAWAGMFYGYTIITLCIFAGMFVGTSVGTMVGIAFYRRHLKSKPATAFFKTSH